MNSLSEKQCQQVIERTHSLIEQAAEHFQRGFSKPAIQFNLTGQRAGLYAWHRARECTIDFNSAVFATDFTHHLNDTVAHEVAHHVAQHLFGPRIKPHGKEWKLIAELLGARPKAFGDYSLEGVKVRRQKRFDYQCRCRTWPITTTRHNRIQKGAVYRCPECGVEIRRLTGEEKAQYKV